MLHHPPQYIFAEAAYVPPGSFQGHHLLQLPCGYNGSLPFPRQGESDPWDTWDGRQRHPSPLIQTADPSARSVRPSPHDSDGVYFYALRYAAILSDP